MNHDKLKEAFNDIIRLCLDIPSVTLQDATLSISDQIGAIQDEDEAAGLLAELLLHVNDLEPEEMEEFQDILEEINELADELTDEFL